MKKSLDQQIATLQQAITAQEALRPILGDDSVDETLSVLGRQLAELQAQFPGSPAPSQERRQRKQVTVLFADLPGFTATCAGMDAEDVSEMMNALWERMDACITEQGGVIDKHIGDAVMALWGTEQAREDDPERAIHAGLSMQAEIQDFEFDGTPLGMRIGVHTGPVLLGQIGTTGEYTAVGDTVNTANRLEEAAPVGGILISHDTYRHVLGVFDVLMPEPIQVKGKSESIQVYQILEAKERAFRMGTRGVEGIETRLIGRDEELEQLKHTFYRTIEARERHVVTILGETGIGKSRLLYEFDHWIDLVPERVRYFKSRAHLATRNLPYALLRSLFSFRFQILDSDPPSVARAKMEQGFRQTLGRSEKAERHAHFVGHLLGFDFGHSPHLQAELQDPQKLRQRALNCLVDYFQTMATGDPVVILLEDMHWADGSSMEAFRYLVGAMAHHPLLIVCTARPGILERYPHWCAEKAAFEQIELLPLSKTDSRRLVDEILQKVAAVPHALREMVVSSAEGNPFYVEELVKMLIEDGVVIKGQDEQNPWRIEPTRLVAIQVPATLTGILQARLDSLTSQERLVLQRAAIVGRIFWREAVLFLGDDADVDGALQSLQDREMVFRRHDSTFADTQEYTFKNVLMCQVTYESVLKKQRRTYHARAADWLAIQSGERAIEHAARIADHLQAAEQREQAVAYLSYAGQQALQLSAYHEAHTLFERALTLAPHQSQIQVTLTIQAGRTASYLGDYAQARRQLQASLTLARQQGDVKNSAAALNYLGEIARDQGDYAEAKAWLEESLALARQADDRARVARALVDLGLFDISLGQYAEAQARFAESLDLYRALDDQHGIAFALNRLGTADMMRGEYEQAQRRLQESLALCQELGDRRGTAGALANLGETARLQKDYAQARPYFEQALAAFEEIGRQRGVIISLTNLGHVTAALDDDEPALAYYLQALRIAQEAGLVPQMLDILSGLARPLARTQSPASGLKLLGLVLHHPALMDETRLVIEPLLADLQAQLPPGTVSAVLEEGQAQSLNETVRALLAA